MLRVLVLVLELVLVLLLILLLFTRRTSASCGTLKLTARIQPLNASCSQAYVHHH